MVQLTRQIIILNANGTPTLALNVNEAGKFADSEVISGWAYENVYMAKELKLVQGRLNNEFAPKSNTLRGEAAALIYQLLQVLNKL